MRPPATSRDAGLTCPTARARSSTFVRSPRTIAGSRRRWTPGSPCSTAAAAAGAVGPGGRPVGVDVTPSMIEAARAAHRRVPGLSFHVVDVYALPFRGEFDIVAAARVLPWLSGPAHAAPGVVRWLADPEAALRGMTKGLRRGGRIVILDYNHEKASWTPEPPASMRRFVQAFLRWRADAGLDNAIADRLGKLLGAVGLTAITMTDQTEVTRRGDPDFETRAGIWAAVAATRGHQMV